MKRTPRVGSRPAPVVSVALCGAVLLALAAPAEPPAKFRDRFTPEYEARVRELMALTGEDERLRRAIVGATPPITVAYEAFYKELAETLPFASTAAREAFLARREASAEAFTATFVDDMGSRFDQLAFDAAVQVYRELYDPEELEQLWEFMQSPVARKFYSSHPGRMEDTVRYAQGQAIHLIGAELPPFIESERERLSALAAAED